MPPIQISLSDEILRLISSAERHRVDLDEFQIPRLRGCIGPLSLQQNIASEVREEVDSFSQRVEALDLLVDDQKGEKLRVELRRKVEELQQSLFRLRKDFRTALLVSKQAIDAQSKSQRDELLLSASVTEKRVGSEKVTDDVLMKANDDVTDALRRTIALMQGELERSVLTTQMLDSSTASLRSTSATHDILTGLIGSSKQLITALEKSDWVDRMLIFTAFSFFILVILFIVKQRILDRGLRVALWWTRFLPDFSEDAQLLRVEKGITKSITLSDSVSLASTIISSALPAVTVTTSLTADPPIPSANETPTFDGDQVYHSSIPSSSDSTADSLESGDVSASTPIHVEL